MKQYGHGLSARELSHLLALLLHIEAGGAAARAAHARAAQSRAAQAASCLQPGIIAPIGSCVSNTPQQRRVPPQVLF